MRLTYNSLSRSKVEYSNKEVLRFLILIKKSSNTRIVENAKVEIMYQLRQILVKNIDNFFYLIKNIEKEPIHTKDDLVGECYFVLQKCIRDFKMKKGKYFYWYYNKSLTRAMTRIVERNYHKHMLVDFVKEEYQEDTVFVNKTSQEADLVDFYIDSYGINKNEARILKSLVNGEKIRDFLKENKDISWNKYYDILNSVKSKFEPMKAELKLHTDVKI